MSQVARCELSYERALQIALEELDVAQIGGAVAVPDEGPSLFFAASVSIHEAAELRRGPGGRTIAPVFPYDVFDRDCATPRLGPRSAVASGHGKACDLAADG